MTAQLKAEYETTSWDQSPYEEPEDGPKLFRADVKRVFRGEFEGESTAILLMSHASDGAAGYVANERVIGKIGDRSGSFVLQHGATMGEDEPKAFGHVVPGSGTGDFTGISGECTWYHDDKESTFTLTYRLP